MVKWRSAQCGDSVQCDLGAIWGNSCAQDTGCANMCAGKGVMGGNDTSVTCSYTGARRQLYATLCSSGCKAAFCLVAVSRQSRAS